MNEGNLVSLKPVTTITVLLHTMLCLKKQFFCKLWVAKHKNGANRPLYTHGKGSMASLTSRKLGPTLAVRGVNGY